MQKQIKKTKPLQNRPLEKNRPKWMYLKPTERQINYLLDNSFSEEEIARLDRGQASKEITSIINDKKDAWAHGFMGRGTSEYDEEYEREMDDLFGSDVSFW